MYFEYLSIVVHAYKYTHRHTRVIQTQLALPACQLHLNNFV